MVQITADKNLKVHIRPTIIQNICIILNFITLRNPFVRYLKNLQTYHLLFFGNCKYIKDTVTHRQMMDCETF